MSRRVSFAAAFVLCLAAAAHAEQVTISGQVLGPDGEPLAECQVLAGYGSAHGGWEIQQAVSDAAGAFSFALELRDPKLPVQVAAMGKGLAIDWAGAKPGEGVTLTLGADSLPCAGSVTDPEGNPIGRADVWVARVSRTRPPGGELFLKIQERILGSTTAEDGAFRIEGLPPYTSVSLAAMADGHERVMLSPVPAGKRDVHIVLQPEATVRGRVLRQGQPVAGVEVWADPQLARGVGAHGRHETTVSQADGAYTLRHLTPGVYNVMVGSAEGLTAAAIEGVWVDPGDHVEGGDLELTAGGIAAGTVTEAGTGRPIPGASVAACGPSRPQSSAPRHSATSDETGSYSLRLAAGRNRIYFQGTRGYGRAEPDERWVGVTEGGMVADVNFVLVPAPKLRGQVLLPDGQPAGGADVGVAGEAWSGDAPESFFRARTDAAGNFEFDIGALRRVEAPWLVFVRHLAQDAAGFMLVGEPTQPVQLRLTSGGYLVADVVDTQGRPVSGLPTRLTVSLQGILSETVPGARSDGNGHLRIGPLPAGLPLEVVLLPESARLAVDETWVSQGAITLGPGEERRLPPLVLNVLGRTVRGYVTDQGGRPVKGALVFASSVENPVTTDEAGDFELAGLPARGMVWIIAAHPTEPLFAMQEVDADWGFRPGLKLQPLGNATGQIVDEQGRPMGQALVYVGTDLQRPRELGQRLSRATFGSVVAADEAGKWRLDGLIGDVHYKLIANTPDDRVMRLVAEFTAKPGETVDLGQMVLSAQ